MRKVVLYVLLIGIIIGVVPYFTGQLAQTKFQDVTHVFSDVDSMPVTITILEYKRGWLKSHAKTQATLFAHNPSGKKFTFFLEHEIRHGPIVQLHKGNYRDWRFARAIVDSKLSLTDRAKRILINEVGDTDLLDVNSEFKLDGAVNIQISGKPLKLKEQPDAERVAWKGVRGEWHLSSDLKHLKGEILIPGFDFDFNKIDYYAEDFSYKTEVSKTPQGIWPGKFMTTLRTVKVNNPAKDFTLTLHGVTTGGVMDIEGSLAEFSGSLRVEKVQLNNNMYGPISYATSFKNINADVFKLLFTTIQKLKTTAEERANNIQNLLALLPELLKTRPEFAVEQLQIQTKQGDIKGAMKIAVGGAQANNINQIKEVFQSIEASGNIVIPKAALKEALAYQFRKPSTPAGQENKDLSSEIQNRVNEAIQKWLHEKALVEQNDHYLVDFELKQGALKINGQIWQATKKSDTGNTKTDSLKKVH